MSTWRFAGSPLSQAIPRSVPEMPNRSRVRFGLFIPVTQSTSEVGAPAMPAGGGGGAGCAAGCGAGCGCTGAALGAN